MHLDEIQSTGASPATCTGKAVGGCSSQSARSAERCCVAVTAWRIYKVRGWSCTNNCTMLSYEAAALPIYVCNQTHRVSAANVVLITSSGTTLLCTAARISVRVEAAGRSGLSSGSTTDIGAICLPAVRSRHSFSLSF